MPSVFDDMRARLFAHPDLTVPAVLSPAGAAERTPLRVMLEGVREAADLGPGRVLAGRAEALILAAHVPGGVVHTGDRLEIVAADGSRAWALGTWEVQAPELDADGVWTVGLRRLGARG